MGTRLQFDRKVSYLEESPYSQYRLTNKFPFEAFNSNRIWKWPSSGTFTLLPIQKTRDFVESRIYESVKFRLSDCNYDPDFWTEIPRNVGLNGLNGPVEDPYHDYFFNCVVPASKVPPSNPTTGGINGLLSLEVQAASVAIQKTIDSLYSTSKCVIASKASFPANQGYVLRFVTENKPIGGMWTSRLLDFIFGDFCVTLHSDGSGDLYQTADFNIYRHWQKFRWADTPMRGSEYVVFIYPHARNMVEIWGSAATAEDHSVIERRDWTGVHYITKRYVQTGGCVHIVPNDTREKDGSYKITEPGPWYLFSTLKHRHQLQVSRLAFYNGDDKNGNAIARDQPQDLGSPPVAPIQLGVDADIPKGTELRSGLYVPESDEPFRSGVPGGVSYQFKARMRGLGDIKCPEDKPPISSVTPELLSYSVDKGAILSTSENEGPSFPVMATSIDHGESPEHDVLIVHVDNSRGQVDAYKRRANMPVRLYDDETGLTLWQGYTSQINCSEAPANEPRQAAFTCRSDAWKLLKSWPIDLNFTEDVRNPGFAWSWQASITRCFEAAGIANEEVVFDDIRYAGVNQPIKVVKAKVLDFPLWREGEDAKDKATNGGTNSERWRPNAQVPIYQFIDHLIRSILGWHWHKSNSDSRWHIYKRPLRGYWEQDLVKAAFFSNNAGLVADQVANPTAKYGRYLMSKLHEETVGPVCTTAKFYGQFRTKVKLSRSELKALLLKPQLTDEEVSSDAYRPVVGMMGLELDNPKGYPHYKKPAPDPNHPDYMGTRIRRRFGLPLAGNRVAFVWLARRFYEDLCQGHVVGDFEADWGDKFTHDLRKWDMILVDGRRAWLTRAEPRWGHDRLRRATYSYAEWRADAAPPR